MTGADQPARAGDWTVIIPFYNEADFLAATCRSLAAQDIGRFRLILVDNGSTDGSADVARAALAGAPVDWTILAEPRPGKIHALQTALAGTGSRFVALGDADTLYPPHYLSTADRLIRRPGTVAAMAMDVYGDPQDRAARVRRFLYPRIVAPLLAKQTHTGGYGQCFDTAVLKSVGGFDEAIWPYVLLDHEIMQRVLKRGRAAYHPDFWCQPSPRRTDRTKVRWTLAERLLYHATPFALKDWYFYRWLGPRLAARRSDNRALREKSWEGGRGIV